MEENMFKAIRTILTSLMLAAFLVSCAPPTPTVESATLTPYKKPDLNGCPIDSAFAKLDYETPADGEFTGALKASGLLPNHWYVFSINGWKNAQGNDLLVDTCQVTSNGQGFCDFAVRADNAGAVDESVSRALPIGVYATKFLLKDAETANSCIVLYNDNPPHFMITKQ
jgi:hypothetical protein